MRGFVISLWCLLLAWPAPSLVLGASWVVSAWGLAGPAAFMSRSSALLPCPSLVWACFSRCQFWMFSRMRAAGTSLSTPRPTMS
eukprot:2980145-Pyramimonas_sp.AAC.2